MMKTLICFLRVFLWFWFECLGVLLQLAVMLYCAILICAIVWLGRIFGVRSLLLRVASFRRPSARQVIWSCFYNTYDFIALELYLPTMHAVGEFYCCSLFMTCRHIQNADLHGCNVLCCRGVFRPGVRLRSTLGDCPMESDGLALPSTLPQH